MTCSKSGTHRREACLAVIIDMQCREEAQLKFVMADLPRFKIYDFELRLGDLHWQAAV